MNAQASFQKIYSFARKNAAELRYRSADIYDSIESDDFEFHLARMMFEQTEAPLPPKIWDAVCAVAHIMCQSNLQQSTPQERLQERRAAEDFYPY